jgi:hypothetical protein
MNWRPFDRGFRWNETSVSLAYVWKWKKLRKMWFFYSLRSEWPKSTLLCIKDEAASQVLINCNELIGKDCSHLFTLVPRSRIFLPWRWKRYVPEDGILHSHRRENLKSYVSRKLTRWVCAPSMQAKYKWEIQKCRNIAETLREKIIRESSRRIRLMETFKCVSVVF